MKKIFLIILVGLFFSVMSVSAKKVQQTKNWNMGHEQPAGKEVMTRVADNGKLRLKIRVFITNKKTHKNIAVFSYKKSIKNCHAYH